MDDDVLLLDKEADLLDFKEKNHKEIQQREQLFEPIIHYFSNDRTKEENTDKIQRILSKSELANPKYQGQRKEETLEQIQKSISKWKLKVYKKGEFLYHFGEDGQKVYLVIKGQALQMKPKQQAVLEKEIQESRTKMKIIRMFKSSSQVNLADNNIQKQKSLKNINQDEFLISNMASNNENQSNNQNNVIKKLQNVFTNVKFQTLKKSQTTVTKLTGFRQLLLQSLQSHELKEMYIDDETNTFKFENDLLLNAGELFGKSAVSEDACRMVSVVGKSEQDLYVLEISKYNYLKIFTKQNHNNLLSINDDNTSSTVDQKSSLKTQKYSLFTSLFEGSVSKIKKFMSFFHHYTYPANNLLWKKHSSTDKLYIILTGRVEISDYPDSDPIPFMQSNPLSPKRQRNRIVIYETGKGNLFGELEIVDKLNQRLFNVRTLEETQVFGIEVNDFRLCENLVPEIVQQIIEKCEVKNNWIKELKSKIKQTMNKYEKNQLMCNQRQEVQEFLQENKKDIKEINIDTIQQQMHESNQSSPLLKRVKEIQKLKEALYSQQQLKQTQIQKNVEGSSSSQLSPLTLPQKQLTNSNNTQSNQYFFSNTQIPRQFLKIDLFANNNDDTAENERKLSRSPTLKQNLSRKNSMQKRSGGSALQNNTPSPLLPLHIDTDKSTQILSTQIKSQNSPLSPLERQNEKNYFFGSSIINNNEDDSSPFFQRKVLKLNKLEINQGQNQARFSFEEQLKMQQINDKQYQQMNETSFNQLNQIIERNIKSSYTNDDKITSGNISRGGGDNFYEKIPSFLQFNRIQPNQRRAQSMPKIFDLSGLPSTDNTQNINKKKLIQQQQQYFQISHFNDEGQIPSIDIPFITDPKYFQLENCNNSNLISEMQQSILNGQPKTDGQTAQNYIFRNQLGNAKLKHISSQLKENRKHNQYRINLEKRSSCVNLQTESLNQTTSPMKVKNQDRQKIGIKNSTSSKDLQNYSPQQIEQKQTTTAEELVQKQQLLQQNQEQKQVVQPAQQQYQYSPSIKSLTNIVQFNSVNSFSNLCQAVKADRNINNSKSPNQINQMKEPILEKTQLQFSFKEKMQKLLHSRKFSVGIPSTSSLSQIIKEKKQQQQVEKAQQNDEIHAINILNLQQFLNKKKNVSLHISNQNHFEQQTNLEQNNQQENRFIGSDENKIIASENEGMNSRQSQKQDNLIAQRSNSNYLINSEKQRKSAQFINEMFQRSQQCRFKVLNDKKIINQTSFPKKSNQQSDNQQNNIRNPSSTPAINQPQFYSNMNSPHEPTIPNLRSSYDGKSNQYFILRNDESKSRKSSLSPSKPQSRQHNHSLNKLSQQMNIHPALFQQQQQHYQQQHSLIQMPNTSSQMLVQNDSIQENKTKIHFNNIKQSSEIGSNFISGTFLTSLRMRQSNKSQI